MHISWSIDSEQTDSQIAIGCACSGWFDFQIIRPSSHRAQPTFDDVDVSDDSDDESKDQDQIETKQFADVPVEKLLAAINKRPNRAEVVANAKKGTLFISVKL